MDEEKGENQGRRRNVEPDPLARFSPATKALIKSKEGKELKDEEATEIIEAVWADLTRKEGGEQETMTAAQGRRDNSEKVTRIPTPLTRKRAA